MQKYLERPLLVPRGGGAAKADLRFWVLILDWAPLTVFVHPSPYFRVATRPYVLPASCSDGAPEPFAHKTNCRDGDNRTPLATLFEELGPGAAEAWHDRTWPLMLDAVRALLFAAQPSVLSCRRRPSQGRSSLSSQAQLDGPRAFELIGVDFAVDDTWRPWLLEANISPNMCEDCDGEHASALRACAQDATESLLSIVVAHHAGQLPLPSPAELDALGASLGGTGGSAEPPERLFQTVHTTDPGVIGGGCCYGARVMSVPVCLARGLDVGAPCNPWLLALREPTLEDARPPVQHSGSSREASCGLPPVTRAGERPLRARSASTGTPRGTRATPGARCRPGDRASRGQASSGYVRCPLPKLAARVSSR